MFYEGFAQLTFRHNYLPSKLRRTCGCGPTISRMLDHTPSTTELEEQALKVWSGHAVMRRGIERRIREFHASGWKQAENAHRRLLEIVIQAGNETKRR